MMPVAVELHMQTDVSQAGRTKFIHSSIHSCSFSHCIGAVDSGIWSLVLDSRMAAHGPTREDDLDSLEAVEANGVEHQETTALPVTE